MRNNGVTRAFAVAMALAAIVSILPAAAQSFAFGGSPRTGEPEMDARLADIDRYGDRYRAAFVDELVRYQAAPRTLVGALLADEQWAPGDVYYACALAQAVGRPCRRMLALWREAHASGWGAIAMRVGVPVGSPEFERIAEGVVSSYARWGRPLPETPPAPAPDGDAGPADE